MYGNTSHSYEQWYYTDIVVYGIACKYIMETNSVKSVPFFFNNKRSDFKLDQTSAATAVFVALDKGPEELPLVEI